MSLRTLLLAAVTYVLLLAIVAFGLPLALSMSARVNAEVRTQARAQADLVAATAGDLLGRASRRELTTLAGTASGSLRGRVLIVNAGGRVLADSAGSAEVGTSYLSRPEIRGALAGHQVQLQRTSRTLGQQILATAAPIIHNGRTAGAVRVTQSIAAVRRAVRNAELAIAMIGATVLAIGLAAGTLLAGQIGRPLRRLEAVARRVAQGDLRARARVEGSLEQRSLSGSFNEMTDRIDHLVSAQQGFVADASHQLRTPLTGLRLRLEEASELAGPGAAEELQAAIGEVDRLSRTVDELLLLSRAGGRPFAATSVELEDLANEALDRWRLEASQCEIGLERKRDGPAGTAWADRADLERAIDALLENALHYSPAGSAVTIATCPARIEIRDRGAGVPANERELAFERFRRGSAGLHGPPGSGLGLAIARELAREWGAEITLEARAGGGTIAALALAPDANRDLGPTPDPNPGLGPARDRGFARA